MKHPDLFFSQSDIENFKNKISLSASAMERYKNAVSSAQECLDEELVSEYQANGRESQHADFGLVNCQLNRFCNTLGIKYLVEGDEKCAEKIRQALLHFITFERWYAVGYTRRTPVPWHADLCSTATTLAMGRAYDIVYNCLTAEERKVIAHGILEKGIIPAFSDWILPETRIHALDSMGHNWWAVCIAEPAMALLALQEELPDESARLLRLADEALAEYLTYKGNKLFNKNRNFDEQGLFYESIGYNNYGTGTLLKYLWCNERYNGRNELIRNALPENLCNAVMSFSYPVTKDGGLEFNFLNFGDSAVESDFSLFMKYALRLGIATPAVRKCAAAYSADICEEIGGLDLENTGGSLSEMPLTSIFSSGYAVTRKSFEADSTVLAVKSGFCWNHSHNDSGTFVIFDKGRPLFIDSGTCNYDSPLYHAYYCQDVSHSVLRIGGEGRRDEELYRGTKFPGSLTDSYIGEDFFFVQADSTGPLCHLCSRMFRNFFWFDNRILVIFDEVYCHKDNAVDFTLHFDADFSREGNTVLFDNGASKARLTSHFPEMTYSVKNGHPDHGENTDMPYIELSTAEKKREHLIVNTIELAYDENPLSFSLIEGRNYCGLRLEDDVCVRKILFNNMADGHIMHDNSNNIIEGFDTDAYILVTTENKANHSVRVLMVCGSYLRLGGTPLISSFTKLTKEIITEKGEF